MAAGTERPATPSASGRVARGRAERPTASKVAAFAPETKAARGRPGGARTAVRVPVVAPEPPRAGDITDPEALLASLSAPRPRDDTHAATSRKPREVPALLRSEASADHGEAGGPESGAATPSGHETANAERGGRLREGESLARTEGVGRVIRRPGRARGHERERRS